MEVFPIFSFFLTILSYFILYFIGEIVDIEDPDTPRTPVVSQTDGIVFSMARHKLVRPGQVIIKVAGSKILEWRTGNLLTSR